MKCTGFPVQHAHWEAAALLFSGRNMGKMLHLLKLTPSLQRIIDKKKWEEAFNKRSLVLLLAFSSPQLK